MENMYILALVYGIVVIAMSIFQYLYWYFFDRPGARQGHKLTVNYPGGSIRIGLAVGILCFVLAAVIRPGSVEPALITMDDGQSLRWCLDNGSGNCLKSECEARTTTVVYFRAGWCSYCKKMENGTFRDKRVIQELSKYGRVFADSKEAGKLFSRFGIRGMPTTVVLNAECKEKGRIRGYNDPDEFLEKLRAI